MSSIKKRVTKMPKTTKQLAIKIRSLKKQIVRLEKQKKRAAARKKPKKHHKKHHKKKR